MNDPISNQITIKDSGIEARDRLQSRVKKIRSAAVTTYLTLLTFILVFCASLGSYAYWEYSKGGIRATDYRTCTVSDMADNKVTGRREYSYLQRSFLGIDYRLAKDTMETTQIDIRGGAITAVGMTADGKWWSDHAGIGEQGIMKLKDADTYVFTLEKKALVISYDQFCR